MVQIGRGIILQFSSCAVVYDWDDKQSVKYLASNLRGNDFYVLVQKQPGREADIPGRVYN